MESGLTKVTEFLAGADLLGLENKNTIAAFMIHQAAEHALHTILKATTGLHLNTHNINKPIRYCSIVSYKLPEIFTRDNEKNERLFQLLQKAYIESRYSENYVIRNEDLIMITEKIRQLTFVLKNFKTSNNVVIVS